jgi:SAM-dependent methyltransferase
MTRPADVPTQSESATLWTAFWRTSGPDGCTAAFPPSAQQAIAAGWQRVFAGQAAGTRLLDIACGRGAVMAAARAAGIASRTGVDIAAADVVTSDGEHILSGVDARVLPFADRAFDLVVSQFGLEYAGLSDALSEAARVSGRDIAILLHAADGAVVTQAREQARQAHWIDAELDGFGALERGGRDLAAVFSDVVAAARTAPNTALLEAFQANAQMLATQDDAALRSVFAGEWREHAARMRDLVRAAPDADAAAAAAASLRMLGFVTQLTELRADGALVGRWLVGRRGATVEDI